MSIPANDRRNRIIGSGLYIYYKAQMKLDPGIPNICTCIGIYTNRNIGNERYVLGLVQTRDFTLNS